MRMQPTFRIHITNTFEETLSQLRAAMSCPDLGKDADMAGSCLDFRVPSSERRLWSPHLSVQLSPTDESLYKGQDNGRVELFGRFSPRPEIWTFVMVVYFAATFLAFCGAIYGCAQMMLGSLPWAFFAIPVGVVTILGLHLLSVVGQSFSADQMIQLRERLDRVMEEAFETKLR